MLKRLTVAVAALSVLATSAFAAGTVPGFSLAQQQDSNGTPLVGCKLYVIQAGTVATPQNAYQDSGLTIPLSNPVICDAYGRLPQIFLADGSIKLRLTKSNGTQVFAADGILVVGASSGGGGGSPVDPTTVLQTGWLQPIYGTGVVTGFVRANGRTIGSATSGATERANADTVALFTFLYNQDLNLAVSGGRGASAAADFAANKTIALPDWRGRAMAFLDDMGNSAAGRLTVAGFGVAATVLGAASTATETKTLAAANIPPLTSSGNNTISIATVGFNIPKASSSIGQQPSPSTGGNNVPTTPGTWSAVTGTDLNTINAITVTSTGTTSTPVSIVQPTMLATIYIKL